MDSRLAAPILAVAGLWLVACARQGAIPGGPADRVPPIVVETEPEGFAVLTGGFDGPVKIRFNERISERSQGGSLDGAVVLSPAIGEMSVSHGRSGIEISQEGGFPPGRVYRVTVLPRIQDMFNNTMRGPFELVFSTGPDFSPGVIAGIVTDRITGQPVATRVEAVVEDDSVPTWTLADQDGVFALRYLPPGAYELTAYEDRNFNAEPNFLESQGRASVPLEAEGDTTIVTLSVLLPDTTPAVMASVEVVDSVTLVATFDDFFDPDVRQVDASASASREDGEDLTSERVLLPLDWEAIYRPLMPEDERAIPPGGPEDQPAPPLPTGQARRPGDVPALPEGRAQAPDPGQVAPDQPQQIGGEPRPEQRLYIRFTAPFEIGVTYTVRVADIVNINGVEGGGGEVQVVREAEPADPFGADSAAVGDSAVVGDSVSAPDTALVGDTAAVTDTVPGAAR